MEIQGNFVETFMGINGDIDHLPCVPCRQSFSGLSDSLWSKELTSGAEGAMAPTVGAQVGAFWRFWRFFAGFSLARAGIPSVSCRESQQKCFNR